MWQTRAQHPGPINTWPVAERKTANIALSHVLVLQVVVVVVVFLRLQSRVRQEVRVMGSVWGSTAAILVLYCNIILHLYIEKSQCHLQYKHFSYMKTFKT